MICDIKSSRCISNRKELQYKIINMINETNLLFSDMIISPFAITSGDEWEGLLKADCDYHKLLQYFKNILGTELFYCGLGKGEVTIDDFSLTANQLDGPSFYLARKAIAIAKEFNFPLIYIMKEGCFDIT